mgnify:CR=1 FL=1
MVIELVGEVLSMELKVEEDEWKNSQNRVECPSRYLQLAVGIKHSCFIE